MRIAIPTDDELTLAHHTGRCRGFAIYDIADGQARMLEYRRNVFTNHHHGHEAEGCSHGQHGENHGLHSHAGLLDGLHDCQVVIALGMGPRLIADLEAKGLRVIFSRQPNVAAAAKALAAGEPLENPAGSMCYH